MISKMDNTICHWTKLAARLRVSGSDAATFLQGQFSNDLRRAEPCPATYGLWLNHKGRALADSHVLQVGPNEFEIISRTSASATIRERLETYIIADDVVVEDVTGGCVAAVIAGPRIGEVLEGLGAPGLAGPVFARVGDLVILPARCDAGPSWFVVAPEAHVADLRSGFERLAVREVDAAVFESRRLAAGIPSVPDELGPDDLPMEGGLEHDAISFTKGCYLGQEVMARLHNLGQVRRRLYLVRLAPGAAVPARGTPLFAGAQRLGDLRAAVPAVDAVGGGGLGLAMLQAHAAQPGLALSVAADAPPTVHVERLAEGRAP